LQAREFVADGQARVYGGADCLAGQNASMGVTANVAEFEVEMHVLLGDILFSPDLGDC